MVSCFASPSPAPSKQLHFVLSPSLEVACLGVSSDSRRESTKRDTHVASDCIPLLFLFFFFHFTFLLLFPLFFCFTAECKNAIIVAVSGRGRQFGRGERRCCLRHVYRELCQMTMGKGRETRTESREWQDVGGGARE